MSRITDRAKFPIANFTSTGIDDNANSTAITLTTDGNLLFGKTTNDDTFEGTRMTPIGFMSLVRDGGRPLFIRRDTSDGDMIELQRDGNSRGKLGVDSTLPYYVRTASGGFCITSSGGEPIICGADSTGAIANDKTQLGAPLYRFTDLYLTGGVYLNNQSTALDDYEEGTFTMSSTAWDGDIQGDYVKVGRMVTVHIAFNPGAGDTTWATSDIITGLPFTAAQTTNAAGGNYNGGYYYGGYMLSNQSSIRGRFTVAGSSLVIIDGFSTTSNYSASVTYITTA